MAPDHLRSFRPLAVVVAVVPIAKDVTSMRGRAAMATVADQQSVYRSDGRSRSGCPHGVVHGRLPLCTRDQRASTTHAARGLARALAP